MPAPPATPVLSDAERYPAPRTREPPAAPIESPALPLPPGYVSMPKPPAPEAQPPVAPLPAPPKSVKPVKPAPAAKPPPSAPAAEISSNPPSGAKVAPRTSPRPPASAPPADAPARAAPPAAGGPASEASTAEGRWSVQVGVFAVAQNAESLRARVASRLSTAALAPSERAVRTVSRDGRTHVVVGELPDRPSAQKLAQQLRDVLRQDVVLFRW